MIPTGACTRNCDSWGHGSVTEPLSSEQIQACVGGVHGKYCNPGYTDSWDKRTSSSRPAWTILQYLVSTQNGVGIMSAQWRELAWHTWRVILSYQNSNSENTTIHQKELSLTINLNILTDMLNNILKNMLAIGTSLFLQFSLRLGLKKTAGFSYLNTICCNLFFDCSIVHEKIWPHTICDFYSLFRLVCYCIRFFLKVCCNEPPIILSINILYAITLNCCTLD